MRCSTFREALSARLDGEDPGLPDRELDHHVARCSGCRAWVDAARALAGIVDRAPRHHVALDPAVLAALVSPGGGGRVAGERSAAPWRLALVVVAVAQLAIAWSGPLVEPGHVEAHLAHELTAWDVGLAVGFLVAGLRPARAWGMLPLAAVLVACLAGTSVIDLLSGHALLGREAVHLLEIAGLGGIWVLARRVPRPSLAVRPA